MDRRRSPEHGGGRGGGNGSTAAALLLAAMVAVAPALFTPALAAPGIAAFEFELVNTSLEPTRPDETERLRMLDALLAAELRRRDAYAPLETSPVRDEVAKHSSLRECQGCELDLAKRLGAEYAALGWVQKVSNLILNINLQIREVGTGRLIRAGSVDIRGNNDESWRRGLVYLLDRRIFKAQ